MEFRIRESEVGFSSNSIKTFFIPEVLILRYNVPTWKFWKKERVVEKWATFYKTKDGSVQYNMEKWMKAITTGYIMFPNIGEAENWLKEYKVIAQKQLDKFIEEMLRGAAVNCDNKTDKIHPAK